MQLITWAYSHEELVSPVNMYFSVKKIYNANAYVKDKNILIRNSTKEINHIVLVTQ